MFHFCICPGGAFCVRWYANVLLAWFLHSGRLPFVQKTFVLFIVLKCLERCYEVFHMFFTFFLIKWASQIYSILGILSFSLSLRAELDRVSWGTLSNASLFPQFWAQCLAHGRCPMNELMSENELWEFSSLFPTPNSPNRAPVLILVFMKLWI